MVGHPNPSRWDTLYVEQTKYESDQHIPGVELDPKVPESLGPAADAVHGAAGLVQPGPKLQVVGAGVLVRPQVEEEGDDLSVTR